MPTFCHSIHSINFDDATEIDLLPEEIVLTQEKNQKRVKQIKIKDIYTQGLISNKKVSIAVENLERGLYILEVKNSKKKDLPIEIFKIILI